MMDRNREARRAAAMVASSNGLSRRRHRSNSLRDSPDEDGPVELQESVRLRERVKKDRDRDRERDRERDRDRDRERERERERERSSRSSKRRRGERLMIHGNREDGGEDSSEESVNDDEDEEDEDNSHSNNNGHHNSGGIGCGVRLLPPPNPNSGSVLVGSISNHYHTSNINNHHHHNSSNNHNQQHHHLYHRKSFPLGAAKVFRAAPVWKPGDEMIGVSVPRKARSASVKRSHDWMSSSTGGNSGGAIGAVGGGAGEQIHRQASTSPVRQSLVSASTPAPPMSPSSSNASVRKKIKPNSSKQPRPPKSSSKASSSNPEELEIEIAEVLYGLKTQSQGPPKKEILSNDSTEVNRSSSDAKSRVSSPISNSPTANFQSPAVLPSNSSYTAAPISAVAPKRKRPRQVSENPGSCSFRSSPISSATAKVEFDQMPKVQTSSPNLAKSPGSVAENGFDGGNSVNSQGKPPEPPLPEPMKVDSESKLATEGLGESRDVTPKEEVMNSQKMEFSAARADESNCEDTVKVTALASLSKANSGTAEVDSQREEKFQIDLEAPPPQLRSSPEREREINLATAVLDNNCVLPDLDVEMKPVVAEKAAKVAKEEVTNLVAGDRKSKLHAEESQMQKRIENKGRNIDLQLDLEKPERDNGFGSKFPQGNKQQQQQNLLLPPLKTAKEETHAEKSGHSSSLPLPMSTASWPGGLPPLGYMAPIQGVVSMDGSNLTPAPIQPFFSQPRPKRCGTHCHIARNIQYFQQLMKMNPFWPAPATSASLFGSKPCNLSVVPPADLHGNISARGVNGAPDKAQGLAVFSGHGGKDKSSQPSNVADAGQRKQQIILQQALPPVAPNNLLPGPAFIFPLSQPPAAVAAASARPGSTSTKPTTNTGSLASSNASNSAAATASATVGGAATAVSFNYPNMPANETQYLAILQNNAYPFPIPTVGAPPNYRGTHPQALPLFNGSFYSSQIIHPSQLQQPVSQSHQMQPSHQNTSMSSGSSSSQKNLQNQQQRPTGTAVGSGSGGGNLHNFATPRNRQSQQSQQPHNQQSMQSQARYLENEAGPEDSPSTADSRGSRGPLNFYGQNFAMPIHPQNYALLATPAALVNASGVNGSNNQNEKKQQQPQQQALKTGLELLPPQTFAMSFASLNGASSAAGIDVSSMAQNHGILQSLPEATRHNIQIMAATAAAQVAQQRKNFRISEDGKTGGDSTTTDDERKGLAGKSQATTGQSIAFSRAELNDASVSAAASNVIDSSARSLNLASGAAWSSRFTVPNAMGTVTVSNAQLQAQHQPQQMIQLHKQQQQLAAAARSKTAAASNSSVYAEHLSSSSPMSKFPNALSTFPQNLVQTSNSSSPTQSPQWKNSSRTVTSQAPPSFVSSTTSSSKGLPQQQGRPQQNHTQISFGANQKTPALQGQQTPSSNQSPSSPMMVGSPSTSSMSKGASGSPRTTTSASASSKTGQASSLSAQPAKNSAVPGQKSSPVSGRNVPSILGNPHITSTSSAGTKPQMQQQPQQLPKNIQQAQLFFSNPYMQSQSPHSTTTNTNASAPAGYYIQRRRSDQQQQQPQPQQPSGSSTTSSTGMLTLCPVTVGGAGTSDPAKAIAAATVASSNMKGGSLPPQSILHAVQFAAQPASNQHHPIFSPGLPYIPTVPAAVQVKPTEQKQPAGNDNLHACWQPEKK